MLKNLKKILLFFILINSFNVTNAQETLINIEKEYKSKTYLSPDYYEVVAKYAQALSINNKKEQSITVLIKNIELAKKNNDHGNTSYLYSILSIEYFLGKENSKSDLSLKEAEKHSKKTNRYEIKGFYYYVNAWIFLRKQKKVEAVNNYINAINNYNLAAESKKIYKLKSTIYIELSRIYGDWKDEDLQEKYSLKSLEYALKQDNKNEIFSSYMAVGHLYDNKFIESKNLKYRDLVEFYYLKAFDLFQKNEMLYISDLAYVSINIANLYLAYYPENYTEKVLKYTNIAKDIATEQNEYNYIANANLNLGEIAKRKGNYNEAKTYYLQALNQIQNSFKKDTNVELNILQKLIDLEELNKNYFEVSKYQKEYLKIYIEVFDYQQHEASKRIEAEFEKKLQEKELEKLQLITDKKEQQIQLLNFQNLERETQYKNLKLIEENQSKKLTLSELITQKKQQELKLLELETQAKSKEVIRFREKLAYREQTNNFYALIILSIILIVILLLFLLRQRTKRMLEKEKSYKLAIEKEKQHAKISALTSLLDGQEKERERLARDLHDGLGGLLSATKLQLSDLLNKKNEIKNEELKVISDHIDFAINKLRKVSHNLMPDLIIKYGLEVALKEFAIRMKNNNLEIHVHFLSYTNTLETEKQLFVYRIIQELVNNAIKHAQSKHIIIQLVEETNLYQVTVEDDGIGFEVNNLEFKNSAGFLNIQSRIHFLKGTFEVHSEKNLGTSFEFNFPKK
ncbi:sensor histidine kinase [Flavobacterium sp. I3-2]|uniref:sensor histidine kinase n=1 Tax=Flavobacterium sp. I3-2 TaxID=2748319 RepID=UPI0015AA0BD1|nr:sensor histidine kinase [Flavobacterium sp. I3-2]